jgi:hypothetical protein
MTFGPFSSPTAVLIALSHAIGNFLNHFSFYFFSLFMCNFKYFNAATMINLFIEEPKIHWLKCLILHSICRPTSNMLYTIYCYFSSTFLKVLFGLPQGQL